MAQSSKYVSVTIDVEEEEDAAIGSVVVDLSGTMCDVCYAYKPLTEFIQFCGCGHAFCQQCVKTVFESNVMESRVDLQCLQCGEEAPQHQIRQIMDAQHYEKYLYFTLRKFLATQQPDVCYCLAPNCPYACINACPNAPSSSDYTERNHFVCGRETCNEEHCNKCKKAWHPGKSCEEFKREREDLGAASVGITDELKATIGAKNCPACAVTIEKASDGSCNQVVCAVCQTSFCWLCGKPVTEMHYMR